VLKSKCREGKNEKERGRRKGGGDVKHGGEV